MMKCRLDIHINLESGSKFEYISEEEHRYPFKTKTKLFHYS